MKKFLAAFMMIVFLLTFTGVCFADCAHCNNKQCDDNCRCCDKDNPKRCPHCGTACGRYDNGVFVTLGYYPYPRYIYHKHKIEDVDVPDIDIRDIDIEDIPDIEIEDIPDMFEEDMSDWGGDFDGGDMGDF